MISEENNYITEIPMMKESALLRLLIHYYLSQANLQQLSINVTY